MSLSESPFLLDDEVEQRSLLSPTTRWRREKEGRFPRRIKIGARKIAYRRSEILEWESDPEGWAARQQRVSP